MKKVFAILALAASLVACACMEQPVNETPEVTPEQLIHISSILRSPFEGVFQDFSKEYTLFFVF